MLHAGRTDLATARCLADQGIPVYATIVSDADIARYSNSLTGSPMTMRRSPELIAFVCDRLVVQSRIDGGDNHIFDCYGLCNRNGGLVTCASAKTRRTEASPAMVRYHHAV
ncbi:hypothetical protein [Candidatus Endoriftia persephone]|uniref:Uncharacterized protein n=3 Tax=Gammaproteobacteria TaxID=1236 RepID=G2FGD5_9GAMM|nr:hypothetical protein [Candidatus Endoriftia persephone]EGW54208.1 hypothetical protein TevJSym_ap00770 [endosymbiont of Tevnia jerichonana (vent Tica)]USF88581.1 hypothetical protein L0Y14_04925 [Candidatus Endoriftia persephone]